MFYHNGVRVCKNTFLFLHDIGNFRLKAIRAHYLSEGLVPRIHGHTGRTAPNALVLGDIKGLITFVMHYVESNGILLPGRIPGYKRDDIKLLPSSCTKRAVWMLYQDSAISLSLRSVAYTTFCKVWRNFLGDVVVCKPMTDLCATCQKNSATLSTCQRRKKQRYVLTRLHTHTREDTHTVKCNIDIHCIMSCTCVIHKPFTRHSKKQRNTYSELLARDRITAVLWRSVVMPSRHTSVEMESSHFLLLTLLSPLVVDLNEHTILLTLHSKYTTPIIHYNLGLCTSKLCSRHEGV